MIAGENFTMDSTEDPWIVFIEITPVSQNRYTLFHWKDIELLLLRILLMLPAQPHSVGWEREKKIWHHSKFRFPSSDSTVSAADQCLVLQSSHFNETGLSIIWNYLIFNATDHWLQRSLLWPTMSFLEIEKHLIR